MKLTLRGTEFRFACFALLILYVGLHRVPAATDLAASFYDPGTVQEIRIEITRENLERLQRALPKRVSVPAQFRWNDQTLRNVAVRYKGNSSSSPEPSHKRGFLVDFSEYKKGQRFLGLRHVALDNGIQFGSLFSERIITDILRSEGVKASRCNYVQLFLNDKCIGVYVNEERIDKSFLENHFGNADGILFKVDEGGPGSDLRLIGNDPDLYRRAFELHSGGKNDAYPRLIEFVQEINGPTDLGKILDVDAFIKTTAVTLLAGAFDQYTGWNAHNYYLYRSPSDRRWTYIPWDLDVGFADKAFGQIPVLDGWNAAWPEPAAGRPLMEKLISDPISIRAYRTQADLILEKYFRPETLIPKLRGLYAQIRGALADDPFPPHRVTNPGEKSYEEILASMEAFIRKRYAMARAQLDDPGARPEQKRNDEGPKPGPPSPDAPTHLQVVKATANTIELTWTDHAEGEVAYVLQRSDNGEDFANVVGQPGPDVTTITDRNVQPGKKFWYRVYAVLPTPQGPRGTGPSTSIVVQIPEK